MVKLSKKSTDTNYPSINEYFKAFWNKFNVNYSAGAGVADNSEAYIKEGYTGNVDVYSIIRKITQMATQANPELLIVKGDKEELVTDAEFNRLLDFPSPNQPFDTFQEGYLIYLLSTGNSYVYNVIGGGSGLVREMHIMPGQNIEALQGTWKDPIKCYKLTEGYQTTEFSPEEVTHARFFNPLTDGNNRFYGLSPLSAAARTVAKNTEAEKLQHNQFKNGAPDYILYPESTTGQASQKWNTEQKDQRKKWLRGFSRKKEDVIYVAGEKVGMLKMGVSASDLAAIESSQDGLIKLCNVFCMPPQLFGVTDSTAYNNMKEAKKDGWNMGLKPLLDTFAKHLTILAKRENENYVVRFNYSEIPELQEDLKEKLEGLRLAYPTPNELRLAAGLEAIESDFMNEPMFTMSDVPLSDMALDKEDNEPS